MKRIEIKIPEIAENVESGLIAAVLVSKGDQVSVDQPLVEVETDKATTDIPSTHAGTVEEIKVEEGDEVKVSQVIVVLSVNEEEEESSKEEPEEKASAEEEPGEEASAEEEPDEEEPDEEASDEQESDEEEPDEEEPDEEDKEGTEPSRESGEKIAATPLVRKMAREEGIDLKGIRGSGPQGRITKNDLQSKIGKLKEEKDHEQERDREEEKADKEDSDSSRPESREKLSRIRKITAERMQDSWRQIPHVTQSDQADITALERFRQQEKPAVSKTGGNLTITALLLKFTAYALQRFPRFNATLDAGSQELIRKHEIHIGVAVDTDRGLIVPVIRDVNRKSLAELSLELTETAEKARNKKISPGELQGGTFTLSNLGGIGGTTFTPIIYPPQVAILGISRSSFQPVYVEEELRKRLIMPLSLSYDHRVIDGAEGARFLSWICRALEDPFAMLK